MRLMTVVYVMSQILGLVEVPVMSLSLVFVSWFQLVLYVISLTEMFVSLGARGHPVTATLPVLTCNKFVLLMFRFQK